LPLFIIFPSIRGKHISGLNDCVISDGVCLRARDIARKEEQNRQ